MLPTAEELIEARSEPVQFGMEWLASREEGPPEPEYKGALRMENVYELGLALRCYETVATVRQAGYERGITRCVVKDRVIDDVSTYFKGLKKKAWVRDSFTDELQVIIDLAHHAGYHDEVNWITSVWEKFKPLPIAQPSSV